MIKFRDLILNTLMKRKMTVVDLHKKLPPKSMTVQHIYHYLKGHGMSADKLELILNALDLKILY